MADNSKLWTRDFLLTDITGFLIFLSFYFMMATFQYFVLKLGGNLSSLGLVMGVFTIVAVIFRPFTGNLLDTRGRRVILLLGIAIIIASFIAYALVSSIIWLLVVRVIHGIGWAFATTAVSTIVADLVPPSRRGEAMGYYSNFMDIAMAIGPFIGILFLQWKGFTAVFIGAALTLLPALVAMGMVKDRYRSQPVAGQHRRQLISRSALLPALVMFTGTIGFGSVMTFLPTFVVNRGITGQFLGVSDYAFFYIVYALTLLLTRGPWGHLSDRHGRHAAIIPGLFMFALGTLLLAYTYSLPLLLLSGIVYAAGFGSAQPAIMAWTVDRASASEWGAAVGTFFAAFDGGIGLGALVMGPLAQHYSYWLVYMLATGLTLIGFLIYLVEWNRNRARGKLVA